ncbi:amino acid adenylation domain-containing protein [Streptacidiphilus sp. EB129]|uniref:amino acid adenylation domain-containing protein n=1 Tax=Streptacidiphilus sp. EB129 TaxID=3156262 RepID=UPI00351231C9
MIQTVIEGDGELRLDDLTAAVARAADVLPGTRLRRRGRMWVAVDAPPPVRQVRAAPDGAGLPGGTVVPGVTGTAGGLEGPGVLGIAALHDPLPAADGAFCEVLWCPGTPAVLVFRASHAVMDGRGKALWIADVFRALRGEDPVGAADPVTDADAYQRLGITNAESTPDVWHRSPLPRPQTVGTPRTTWVRRTVDGYHPALTAKVATALTAAFGLDPGHFAVAFDLRRHLPEARTTGNMVQTELFQVAADEPWQALHERLLSTMAAGREISWRLDPSLLKTPLFALRGMIRVLDRGRKDRHAAASVLSHLGRVEPTEVCAPSFEARSTYLLPLLAGMTPPELNFVEFGGRTELTLTWRTGAGTAERAGAVLDAVVERLTPAARSAVLTGPVPGPGAGPTVVRRFREVVARDPGAVALRWPDGEMSFAELDARSEAVAARLRELGQGRGAVVGVLAERSAAAVTALWGVLKAGAAYLPLDPEHPDARLTGLLADAGAAYCLMPGPEPEQVQEQGFLPEGCGALRLDALPSTAARVPVAGDPTPDDLAYVIYTSGSTGEPKGVEVGHAQLASYAAWAGERFGVDASTRFAVFSSLSFDLPNTALYLSTLAGGTLVLVPDRPSHLTIRHLLEGSGANALKLTPSHLDLIARLGVKPEGFRTLVVGGEPLRSEVAARAARQFGPDCEIFNHYGPTEATVGCVVNRYRPEHDELTVVPIGRPAPGCRVHLLDADRRPVPMGEAGEMYLAGAQVAQGYRGRPELTRERFVRLADGSRAYRSGDLARQLESGELEFIGRVDQQAKVMGHRVEPAEVTRALETHPGVSRAVAVVRRGPGGDALLVGYAVAEPGVTPADLTEFLAGRLPRYLVPSAIRLVDDFTQTPNGKIDVDALPDPFRDGLPVAPAGSALVPRGDDDADGVVAAVAGIWAGVLGVDVGRLDGSSDFHQLGGTSVLLLAMLARVGAEVVGADGEAAFMGGLGEIIRAPTLRTVATLARDTAARPA